jgi:hypothetical protein
MRGRISSKVLVVLIVSSMFSAVVVSLNAFTVHRQEVTLEDVLEEVYALVERLEDVEATTTALGATLSSLIMSVDKHS